MANLSASFKEVWATDQQEAFYKVNVARQICDTSYRSQLSSGDTLHRPYRTAPGYPKAYVRGTDMTERTLTTTDEYLTVASEYYDFFYVDDHDKMQSNYNEASKHGKDGGETLSQQIDSDVLGEALNAASYVDAGNVGGTAGQAISLSTTTIVPTVTTVSQKLTKLNVFSKDRYAVVSPEWTKVMVEYGVARATAMGDSLNRNPDFMSWLGYDFYESNQLCATAVLELDTQPTDGDTVTIAGVTFTFKTALGSTAGNVLIGGSADAANANLTALINDPSTTTAQGVALSSANQDFFNGRMSAVSDTTGNTVTVTAKGVGVLDVSETLTAAGDVWTPTLQVQHQLFGVRGNPVLVVQEEPNIEFVKAEKRKGYFYQNTILYGWKTFADNAKQMVDVRVDCSAYNA